MEDDLGTPSFEHLPQRRTLSDRAQLSMEADRRKAFAHLHFDRVEIILGVIEEDDLCGLVACELANELAADRSASAGDHDPCAGYDPLYIAVLDANLGTAEQIGQRHALNVHSIRINCGAGPGVAKPRDDQILFFGQPRDLKRLLPIKPFAAVLHDQADRAAARLVETGDDRWQHVWGSQDRNPSDMKTSLAPIEGEDTNDLQAVAHIRRHQFDHDPNPVEFAEQQDAAGGGGRLACTCRAQMLADLASCQPDRQHRHQHQHDMDEQERRQLEAVDVLRDDECRCHEPDH